MTRGVALVTGARGGLGQALIRRLRQAEYDVIAHSRGAVLDTDTAVRWLDGDLSDPVIAQRIADQAGRIDLLVNNAADQSLGALDVLTGEDWAAMIGATLMSAVNLAQAAHSTMGPGASIINISSVEATSPFPATLTTPLRKPHWSHSPGLLPWSGGLRVSGSTLLPRD